MARSASVGIPSCQDYPVWDARVDAYLLAQSGAGGPEGLGTRKLAPRASLGALHRESLDSLRKWKPDPETPLPPRPSRVLTWATRGLKRSEIFCRVATEWKSPLKTQ